jgi:hypothetical protein
MKKLLLRRPSPALAVSFVALLVALGGTSFAAFSLSKNSVGTTQLKKNAVTTKKIKNGAVTRSKMNFSGVTVPNATHANTADNATHANTADNATTIGGASLDSLSLGRSTASNCDPSSAAFIGCGTVSLNLPRAGRVLILANVGYDGGNSNSYSGACRLETDATTVVSSGQFGQAAYAPATVGGPGFNANTQEGGGLTAVTASLPAGTHDFSLNCNQAGGSIEFSSTMVSAVMLGNG